ncbi:MAG: class II fructose-bisphosphate aldolase [Candidatus Brocadiaceae bacterium]
MLSSLEDVIPALDRGKVCAPAFDIGGGQPDFLLGVLRACEEAGCPAIMLVWGPAAEDYLGLDACVELAAHYAERSSVPLVLHLDHGLDEEVVEKALEAGFRSVMFDASDCPLAENIRRTRRMAERAHEQGATIEGELGRFGQEQDGGEAANRLTDPDEAERFVRETGVDMLAPAVGNAHGFYRKPPRLRFDLIEEISSRTAVPLSLHGGTGIPLEDVRRAGELGMRKINIASQIHKDFAEALRCAAEVDPERKFSWRTALGAGREAISARVGEYIGELGAERLL